MEDRLIVVSADGHAAAPIETYRPYLESRHHGALDAMLAEEREYRERIAGPATPDAEARKAFDDRGAVGNGGADGSFDLSVRMREMDLEGCAAEIVHSGTQSAPPLWYGVANRVHPAELQAAGTRAYHRWLAEMMDGSGGRMAGVAEPGPCLDLDATIAELEWVAGHGFVAVGVPRGVADDALPPVFDPYYEPFWSACEDLGLVLSMHAGWGSHQGAIYRFFDILGSSTAHMGGELDSAAVNQKLMNALATSEDSPLRLALAPRQGMWQLMLGGVFDRHPGLRLALTEIRADWVPATLAALDHLAASVGARLARRPSEYFALHCAVAPSSIHRAEVEMRHEIGVPRMLFGMDYPHHEATWPNTHAWIQAAFTGVPEDEARLVLGENAIAFYGLDRARLAAVAARIGPAPADVLGDGHVVEPRLLEHFHKRAGFARDADPVDVDAIDAAFRDDLVGMGAA